MSLIWVGAKASSALRVLDWVAFLDKDFLMEDDELFSLYLELRIRKKMLRLPPVIPAGRFSLDSLTPADSRYQFRFEPMIIRRLAAFFFPNDDFVVTQEHDKCLAVDALCMFLRQMAHSIPQRDLVDEYFCSVSRISRVTNYVARIVGTRARAVLSGLDEEHIKDNIEDWTTAVERVACGYETGVYAFIDSKLFFTTRLIWCKKAVYSGHKHRSGVKFQTIVAPNGIVISVYGPAVGRSGDGLVLQDSGILPVLRNLYDWGEVNSPVNLNDGLPPRGIAIYGDSAYPRRRGIMAAYKRFELDAVPARVDVQNGLNEARSEQEHWYAGLVLNWRGISNPLEMKLGMRPVPAYIWSIILLEDIRVCAEGTSQICRKFELSPPTVNEFLDYCDDRAGRPIGGRPF
jgi:hypothetical protein